MQTIARIDGPLANTAGLSMEASSQTPDVLQAGPMA